jgi:hypothetical protein
MYAVALMMKLSSAGYCIHALVRLKLFLNIETLNLQAETLAVAFHTRGPSGI